MAIMNVLAELHQEPDLKLNLKFEIEVLCKNLSIDVGVSVLCLFRFNHILCYLLKLSFAFCSGAETGHLLERSRKITQSRISVIASE